MRQLDWRLLAQWLVMVVLAAALGLAVMALLGMGAVLAIGLAGADVLAGLPPLLLAAGAAAGLLWWLTRRGWGHGLVAALHRTADLHALGLPPGRGAGTHRPQPPTTPTFPPLKEVAGRRPRRQQCPGPTMTGRDVPTEQTTRTAGASVLPSPMGG